MTGNSGDSGRKEKEVPPNLSKNKATDLLEREGEDVERVNERGAYPLAFK